MGAYPPRHAEDLVEKYQKYRHQELYEGLKAGDPDQVDGLLTEWKKIVSGTHDLSVNLGAELKTLARQWTSNSGDEFHRRLDLIVRFAADLATDIGEFHDTLADANGQLREAQQQNEDPDDTDDNDSAAGGAAVGAVVGSVAGPIGTVAGGVIGGAMGHHRDEQQQEQAKNRMVALVAGLAGAYQSTAGIWHVPDPDRDTPGDDPYDTGRDPGSARSDGASVPTDSHDHGTPPGGTGPDAHRDPPPGTGSASDGSAGAPGTAGSSTLSTAGAGPSGAGFDAGVGTGTATGLSAAPPGRSDAVAGGLFAGTTGRAAGPGGVGMRGAGGESDTDEYRTWLTEDEPVWGDDEEAASGLLGRRPPVDGNRDGHRRT